MSSDFRFVSGSFVSTLLSGRWGWSNAELELELELELALTLELELELDLALTLTLALCVVFEPDLLLFSLALSC